MRIRLSGWLFELTCLLALFCATAATSAAAASTGEPVAGEESARVAQLGVSPEDFQRSLAVGWRFMPGDDPGWAAPEFDDSAWATRAIPGRWRGAGFPATGQMAWYRLTLQVGAPGSDPGVRQLGIRMGRMLSAYELYAGGSLLGGVGGLPPTPAVNYNHQRVFPVPWKLVDTEGRLVLALRVWGGSDGGVSVYGGGPFSGEFTLGHYPTLLSNLYLDEFPGLLTSLFVAGFGLYHLYLYRRNRALPALLWFGLSALVIALYTLMGSQFKYPLGASFISCEKVKFAAIYLFPALGSQMVWSLLERPVGAGLRAYQWSFGAWAMVVLAVPGIEIHFLTLKYWQLWSIPMLVMTPWLVLRAARAGDPEARTILAGILIFAGTCVNDMLIDLAHIDTVRLVPYGFVAVMITMAVSLANRFTAMFNRLEHEVAQRTADLREVNLQLAEAAHRDPLTGVLNRRGFVAAAEQEIRRRNRSGRCLTIVLADIDNFKAFNDSRGHACGDHVLKQISDLLYAGMRDVDHLGRWGGEEFIMLLPETDAEGATVLSEKLRAGVEKHPMAYEGEGFTVTMTFGIAVHRKGESLDACIARADTALYTGKARGRNRVMIGRYRGLTLVN